MKINTQPSGAVLSGDEYKILTALLVKMGYAVKMRKEKETGKAVLKRVIYAEEEK